MVKAIRTLIHVTLNEILFIKRVSCFLITMRTVGSKGRHSNHLKVNKIRTSYSTAFQFKILTSKNLASPDVSIAFKNQTPCKSFPKTLRQQKRPHTREALVFQSAVATALPH